MEVDGHTQPEPFPAFNLLQLIKNAQQQHGLRHGDYQRYRLYCSRRIERLRKCAKFRNANKSVKGRAGKFQYKAVTAVVTSDVRLLHILLFDAERAWAYAMQLKQETENVEASRKRFHLISRLRKSASTAKRLEDICRATDRLDTRSKLESQAYCSWIQGSLCFELRDWEGAIQSLSSSNSIYEKLASAMKESGDVELRELYESRCEEMRPQLRICAYNAGDKSTVADLLDMRLTMSDDQVMGADLDKLISDTQGRIAAVEDSKVDWCGGRRLSLADYPKLVAFNDFLSHQFEQKLSKTEDFEHKIALHEKLLTDCQDCIQLIKDTMTKMNMKDSEAGGKMSLCKELESYLGYIRLTKSIDRSLLTIINLRKNLDEGKKAKPQDLIRLYDVVIQNSTELQSLQNLGTNKEFMTMTQAQIAYFKAFRCFSMAETYALMRSWDESLVLLERVLERCNEAGKLIKNSNWKNSPDPFIKKITAERMESISLESLGQLVEIVNSTKYKIYGQRISESSTTTGDEESETAQGSTSNSATLLEEPDTYREFTAQQLQTPGKRPTILRIPPDFQPMPGRPIFFDIALNHITFPSLADKTDIPSASTPANKDEPGGISGLVKGWFWGSGKK